LGWAEFGERRGEEKKRGRERERELTFLGFVSSSLDFGCTSTGMISLAGGTLISQNFIVWG